MDETRTHVIVLGGGIAGLTAAYRLSQREDQPRVTLVEVGDRLGGKLRTERIDGFVVDTGPESLAPGRPNAAQLAAELGVEMTEAAPGGPGAVLVKGRIRAMPEGIGGFMPRRIVPLATTRLFSPAGKVRMAFEPLLPAHRDAPDESLESFATRRLGREAYRRLVEPVASGIFCGDPAQLSILATMPFLRTAEATHGGLVRAVLAERKATASKPAARRPGLMSPRTGMGALVDSLVERLEACPSVTVLLSTLVTSLGRASQGYVMTLTGDDGSERRVVADSLILATPTTSAADLLAGLGAEEASVTLRAMTTASTTTVSLGYLAEGMPDLDAVLPAHGYLIAEPGRGPVRSVTRSTTKFPGRAPAGRELFRIAVRADDAIGDEALVRLARDELARTLGIEAEPVLAHVQRWSGVMPQYAVGHLDRVAEVEQHLTAFPGIRLAGSGTYGLGIPDCVASAERAASLVPA